MSSPRQDEFGGGIFRSPRAPAGCVYDCVNGLVDDELAIYRRGGSAYKTTSDAAQQLVGLAALPTLAGDRVLAWGFGGGLFLLSVDELSMGAVSGGAGLVAPSRAVAAGPYVAVRALNASVLLYGGSRKANYGTGTMAASSGAKIVTGSGTAWLANVDPGMVLTVAGSVEGVVETVDTNTQITLRDPVASTFAAGTVYQLAQFALAGPVSAPAVLADALASAGDKLLVCRGNRIYFTQSGLHATTSLGVSVLFDPTDFHQLPANAQIVGAQGIGDSALIFTTAGVWRIDNLELDLTDSSGNPQQSVTQISGDVVAWGDNGIVGLSMPSTQVLGWRGEVIVPALDDVFALGVDGSPIPLSRGIRSLYQGYVAAGYAPGVAALYQGHYFLPILNGATVVDVLVCRLNQGANARPAWTRMSGHAAGFAYAGRSRPGLAPELLGVSGNRVTKLSGLLTPGAANKNDANGTTHVLDVIENDVEYANRSTTQKVDLLYELQDAAADNPTITGSWASGAEGSSWTALTGSAPENDGRVPKRWRLTERGRNVRFRWQTVGPAAKARVRGRVLYVRDSNRP